MTYQSISEKRFRYLRRDYLGNRSEERGDPIDSYHKAVRGWARTDSSRMHEHCQDLLRAAANPRLLADAIRDIGRAEVLGDGPWVEGPDWFPWSWLRDIRDRVLGGTFRRGKYRKFEIPKVGKQGFRTIEVPDVESRILSKNLCNLLTPILDPDFYPLSFGFRRGRSLAHCLAVAEELHQRGMRHLVCADIRDAFGTVPKNRLLQILRSRLRRSPVLWLIEELLDRQRKTGIPQGLSLSPLFLNLFLDHFLDRWWLRKCPGATLVRYADDLAVFCDSHAAAVDHYHRLRLRVETIGMKVKEAEHEAVSDLAAKQSVAWLGCALRQHSDHLKFSLAESSWSKLESAFLEAEAKQGHEKANKTDDTAAKIGAGWLIQKAAGIEAAQVAAVADKIRNLAGLCGLSGECLSDDLAAEAWEIGTKQLQRAKLQVGEWLLECSAIWQ